MKRKKYNPYGIDLKYELETYKHVGDSYENRKMISKGFYRNVAGNFKKKMNEKRETYAFCNTYSEWEIHVKQSIPKDIRNKKDLLHWFYKKTNEAKRNLEVIKGIFIPIYITMLGAFLSLIDMYDVGGRKEFAIVGLCIIVTFFSWNWYSEGSTIVDFCNDFVKIVEDVNV